MAVAGTDKRDEMEKLRLSESSSASASRPKIAVEDGLPIPEKPALRGPQLHPAFYIATWILFSNSTILFNKWILDTQGFAFPATLTTMHLAFSVFMTQILARTCPSILNPSSVRITGRVYLRNIVPIGILYSFSLVCSNLVYLYLSVAYIQMLKAAAPVVILIVSWSFGTQKPCLKKFLNVLVISGGVALTTIGELQFSLLGFLYQVGGIMFEALRIVMIEVLVNGRKDCSGSDSEAGAGRGGSGLPKMDPLLTLYYYAPVCMATNFVTALVTESSTFTWVELNRIGPFMLVASAIVAFMLNVSSVFLIGRTSGIVLTLSGIFKNILLVFASIILWDTAITFLQWIGYSITILALIYYSLGPEGINDLLDKLRLQQQVGNSAAFITKARRILDSEDHVMTSRTKRKLAYLCAGAVMTMVVMGLMWRKLTSVDAMDMTEMGLSAGG